MVVEDVEADDDDGNKVTNDLAIYQASSFGV